MAEIAVVDDESIIRDLLATSLERLGHRVTAFPGGRELLEKHTAEDFQLVISDYKMPGMNGLDLAEKLIAQNPSLPMILMTAYGTVDTAVKAMKLGVQDFIEKPFQVEIMEHTVRQVLQLSGLKAENSALKKSLEQRYRYVGNSPTVLGLLKVVEEVATSNSTVLITGESGTGKELVAHAIHRNSKRNSCPFIKLNCAAIPESLIESELFGYEKGSYTGAVRTKAGKFELADGGTLMLDEIGEMPLYAQSKLLRVLQEREVTKIGGSEEIRVDVRIVCTTNRDLQEEVDKGNFREDLFYRLNVIPLHLPSLRERKGDIPLLAEHFIRKYNEENGFTVPGISEIALTELIAHDWPGNVRELENVVQRSVVFAKNREITPEDLHLIRKRSANPAQSEPSLAPGITVAEAERQLIYKTLELCNDNRTKAAEMLDISIRTLRNKLNEYRTQSSDE